MKNLNQLRKEYPLIGFELVDHTINPRNEDAFYPLGAPKPERIDGDFVRITNPMGGVDTVISTDTAGIVKLAAWHQKRAEANLENSHGN